MVTITQKLSEILGDVDRPGDFFASGRTEFLAPRLEVEGVGPIALPLLPSQAKLLIKAATRAPYGRGPDTVVDTKVRRTWQIEASRLSIGGKHWAKTLDGIVERAAEGLGVAEPVTAELYKLLVYDKGSFFISHAAVARLLATAAPQAGCDLHLALLTIWESGSAEYNGRENWHYRRGQRDAGREEDASEFDVVEVHDSGRSLSEWRRPDGAATALGNGHRERCRRTAARWQQCRGRVCGGGPGRSCSRAACD